MENDDSMLQYIYELYLEHPYISVDSRKNVSGTIFFALKGAHHDGNAFANDALVKGAAYAVIDDAQYYREGERYLLVADALKTLQELAKIHRSSLHIPVICVTGSNGKTTTKELIYAVLSQRYRCYATQGNLNNHIGVPLSILSINRAAEIAVLEIGANHVGEIAQLCEIAKPTHGLITNIGYAHLEGFGDIEGIKSGKGELYAYLEKHQGVAFINSADSILMQMGKEFLAPIYYPQDQDFYHAKLVEARPYVIYQNDQGEVVTTHLIGKHHFYNISAALCIAKYFGIESHAADLAIQLYKSVNNRAQLIKKGSNIILLDAYNANPTSMQAALESFHFLTTGAKVVILGDMNELGEESIFFHKKIVQLTTKQNYKETLLYGPCMEKACSYNSQALHFKHIEKLKEYIKNRNFTDTAILIKGSHSHRLESLVEYIK